MTKQPRKQRNRRANAPLHERQKQVRATLTPDLRDEYGQRSVRVNAGDTVEVLRGDGAGTEAEVQKVDLRSATIHVEGVTIQKADGEDVQKGIDASNVRVTGLDLDDDQREARLEGDDE
ncbi:50S ribosomal protein L24 [Halomarina salina]|uniref:Large ribosomal subunit protein uL24 n=1 Tax=Halomarina salina TaxID=1872699 RepID=A0ABD5RQA3_9EURY|nr:50S ribosomal protein L24 [Halomarina salina]